MGIDPGALRLKPNTPYINLAFHLGLPHCLLTSRAGMSGAMSRWLGSIDDLSLIAQRLLRVQIENAPAITREDIDLTVQKILDKDIDNYIFITTSEIPQEVNNYAKSLYEKTGGVEIAVLDCISFLRHFIHLFHRSRTRYVEEYQQLVLNEPDSAVSQPLKELWLSLRSAAESGLGNGE